MFLRYSTDVEVCEWGQTLIRRLFIFIALATVKNKAKTRCVMVCESLALIGNLHVIWCQHSANIAASSVYSTHNVPYYFTQFFNVTAPSDPAIVADFNSFNTDSTNLKTFPFDKKGNFVFHTHAPKSRLNSTPRSAQTRRITKPTIKKTQIATHSTRSKLPSLHSTKFKK